jgi:hypothetical protein
MQTVRSPDLRQAPQLPLRFYSATGAKSNGNLLSARRFSKDECWNADPGDFAIAWKNLMEPCGGRTTTPTRGL